jgi:Reverse transcriptase (RNA-dependent DNA polymerase)
MYRLSNLRHYNLEFKRAIQNKKIFENLTHERPSKRFLDVAHNVGKGDKLTKIKDDNDEQFVDEESRNSFITNFFSELYRRDEEVEGLIEDFLGEEICNHPLVRNSKLNDNEKLLLDRDLEFEVLLTAIKESNLRSAPGIDGFSNVFIHKFFYLFGKPLFDCCIQCLNEGSLLETFATAQIKLIPKKGDVTKIKNWRPISLLSNFYKLLSRAINNRLKKVSDKILGRAQKGFTQIRQIHEVIINLNETINYCIRENIKGAMICVDQSKAFDSVDHGYMEKVFTFFGFGNRFISWIKTIGTGRKACIILENGSTIVSFELLKGTAQGDCPSSLIYNICAQILIFKIELDPSVGKILVKKPLRMPVPIPNFAPVPVPVPAPTEHPPVHNDNLTFETGKNESFADDLTTCTYLRFEDIFSLKVILERFSKISGLKCNYEKTSIMRIGDLTGEIDQRIIDLGFQIVDNCKLLGLNFSQNIDLAPD